MLGRHHVATGLALGMATMPLLPDPTNATRITWIMGMAGAAVLPDLDHLQATAARIWGPFTHAAAALVGRVAGGHRWGTHDPVLAPLVFGLLMLLGSVVHLVGGVELAMLFGLCLYAVARIRFIGWPLNLLASVWFAAWALHSGDVDWPVLSVAVVLGVLVHIAGDMLTTGGIPVPIVWLRNPSRWGLRWFGTGDAVERLIIGPLLWLLVLGLAWHSTSAFATPIHWPTHPAPIHTGHATPTHTPRH